MRNGVIPATIVLVSVLATSLIPEAGAQVYKHWVPSPDRVLYGCTPFGTSIEVKADDTINLDADVGDYDSCYWFCLLYGDPQRQAAEQPM